MKKQNLFFYWKLSTFTRVNVDCDYKTLHTPSIYALLQVEHRLAEIEMQICGASSADSSTEDNERNRESII